MRDPQRPYAQLLTPIAKSQKLLLRLRHGQLLPATDLRHSQAVFALWQKLLAKNIASTLCPPFADIMIYPDDKYIALKLWPASDLSAVKRAYQQRYLTGYLLVDAKADAPYLAVHECKLIVAGRLADRIGSKMWQWLSGTLSSWQSKMVDSITELDADGALDLIGLLRSLRQSPWGQESLSAPPFAELAQTFFLVWRARGNTVDPQRLANGEAVLAADWLCEASEIFTKTIKGYAIRSKDEDMVH